MRQNCLLGVFALWALLGSAAAQAQNKLDLSDMSIKGDILNDNRLRVNSHDSSSMDDRVKYHREFRKEILEEYTKSLDSLYKKNH
jgi:hypothetical protein